MWSTEYLLDFQDLLASPLHSPTHGHEPTALLRSRFTLKQKTNVDVNEIGANDETAIVTLGHGELSLQYQLTPLSERTFQVSYNAPFVNWFSEPYFLIYPGGRNVFTGVYFRPHHSQRSIRHCQHLQK